MDYRHLAAELARQEATRLRTLSHWSDYETPRVALCGASISDKEFSREPTCPTCAVLKARADGLEF